jgi:hypothetical protein
MKALGASEVIDTSANAEWAEVALKLTNRRGVDHVLEMLGGTNVAQSAAAVANSDTLSRNLALLAAASRHGRRRALRGGDRRDQAAEQSQLCTPGLFGLHRSAFRQFRLFPLTVIGVLEKVTGGNHLALLV